MRKVYLIIILFFLTVQGCSSTTDALESSNKDSEPPRFEIIESELDEG